MICCQDAEERANPFDACLDGSPIRANGKIAWVIHGSSAALEKAKSAGAKTQRERDYIAALQAFYQNSEKVPHPERALAWRNW